MSQKLPWFTHDCDARHDAFIKRLEDEFGHFGYAGYFKIIEKLRQDGNDDVVEVGLGELARELRTKRAVVEQFLSRCSAEGKMVVSMCGDRIIIGIKKFTERQKNLRKGVVITGYEPGKNRVLDVEVDRKHIVGFAHSVSPMFKSTLMSSMLDEQPIPPESFEPIQSQGSVSRETSTERPAAALPGDLLDETPVQAKRGRGRPGRPLSEQPGASQQLLSHHLANFKKITGEEYAPELKKELGLAALLLRSYPLERLKELNDMFFKSNDPWIRDTGYSFGIFKTKINALIAAHPKKKTTPAEPSQIKIGTRILDIDLPKETVWKVWNGREWTQERIPKQQPGEQQ